MSQAIKMNVLLAKADHTQAVYNKAIVDQVRIFKNNQGMFKGIKKPMNHVKDILQKTSILLILRQDQL